jgi:hypothetical protein
MITLGACLFLKEYMASITFCDPLALILDWELVWESAAPQSLFMRL